MASSRPSFVGQFVTKSANFGSSYNPTTYVFNPRCHGVVIREFSERSRTAPNRNNLYAEVMLFPLVRIEKIFKSKLGLVSDADFKSKIESHPEYPKFQAKLVEYQTTYE